MTAPLVTLHTAARTAPDPEAEAALALGRALAVAWMMRRGIERIDRWPNKLALADALHEAHRLAGPPIEVG